MVLSVAHFTVPQLEALTMIVMRPAPTAALVVPASWWCIVRLTGPRAASLAWHDMTGSH